MSTPVFYLSGIKAHFYKHRYFYLVLAAVASVYVIPLLFVQLPKGHDIGFHLTRVYGLSEELKLGNIPARIYGSVFYEYGYAAPLFYGDWLLYFPAFLVTKGTSVVLAYKTFIMLCAVLTAVSMYFSARIILGDKRASCFTAVLYSLSTYFATDTFVRHANGEMQSFIFIPIAFAGLYSIIMGDKRRWVLLPLGLCGVLVTHTLTAFVTVIFLALFSLMFITRLLEEKVRILYIAGSAVLFFMLSASFIFPLLEQMSSNTFWGTDGFSATYFGTLYNRSMPNVYTLFSIFNSRSPFIPKGVGIAFPIMIGWWFANYRKTRSPEGNAFLFFALFSLYATSKYFPWDLYQDEFGTLQFPWRLLVFAVFFIALFGGALVKKLEITQWASVFLSVIIVATFYSVSITVYYYYKQEYDATQKGEEMTYPSQTNSIGLGEFLPTGTDKNAIAKRRQIIRSNQYLSEYNFYREDGVFILTFEDNRGEDTFIDLPLLMYKGYKATIETEDGITELPIAYSEVEYISEKSTKYDNNLIRIHIGDTPAGTVRVWYDGTSVQRWSFIVTLLSFIGVAVFCLVFGFKRKKEGAYAPPKKDISDMLSP